ncbi:hypothetical protein LCGC14_3129000, partial [marine sediment metagenome]
NMAQKRTTKNNMPVIREREIPEVAQRLEGKFGVQPNSKYYKMGVCNIIVSPPTDGAGWHLSISSTKRYPTWDEIAHARYELLPDEILMMMELPPKGEYINIHENTFHLHQQSNPQAAQTIAQIMQIYHSMVASARAMHWVDSDELQSLYDFNDKIEDLFSLADGSSDDLQ